MEKLSNLRGKFMSTQELADPFPYLEMGDLAHRLVYHEKAMLSSEELEMIDIKPLGKEAGPMESIELGRVILGL